LEANMRVTARLHAGRRAAASQDIVRFRVLDRNRVAGSPTRKANGPGLRDLVDLSSPARIPSHDRLEL
jgi:hypothetical protein